MRAELPLFPLSTAIVPGLILPLHVFEMRYRRLIADLLMREDPDSREFGLICVREGCDPDTEGMSGMHAVGVSVRVREVTELEDGRYDIVTTGSRRFRLHGVRPDMSHASAPPLLIGDVEYLPEIDGGSTAAMVTETLRRFRIYRGLLSGQLSADIASDADDFDLGDEQLPGDPSVIGYLVTAAMVIPTVERQRLLELPDAATRLRAASSLLRRENALISELGALPALDLSIGNGSPN